VPDAASFFFFIVLDMVNITTLYFSSRLDWRADDGNVIYVRNNNKFSETFFRKTAKPFARRVPEAVTVKNGINSTRGAALCRILT